MPTPEQQFARFRADGRADALAAVFDATAPELLLVAAHLARRGVAAEDLVQATFVDAIRVADRWDESRPLLPWLLGILARNAQAERRRAARRPEPDRLATPGSAAPPVEEAAGRELAERVAAIVRGLPLVYRQVLSLRLAHGLSAGEIAHALGCPVATVKTRLLRGMARLRKALPRGFAALGAAPLDPGRELSRVREAVLDAARAAPQSLAGPAGIVTGAVLVQKLLVAALAVVALAVTWTVWPAAAPRRDIEIRMAPAPADLVAAISPVADRAPVEAAAGAAPESGPTVRIIGRCIADEDGSPLGGTRLVARAYVPGQTAHLERVFESDVSGRFEAILRRRAGDRIALELRHDGRVTREGRWTDLLEAAIDLGDVRLARGHALAGITFDLEGNPVPDVHLRVRVLPALSVSGESQRASRELDVKTGADGRFVFAEALPTGTWDVVCLSAGITVQEPNHLTVPADNQVRVVVRRAGAVTGVAVDASGAPVSDLILLARAPGTGESVGAAQVAKDGRFRLFAYREGLDEIEIVPQGDRFVSCGPVPRFRVGTEGARVPLDAAPTIALQVVDAATGAPIEAFAVFLTSETRGSSTDLRPAAVHADGCATVAGLRAGRNLVRIVPTDATYAVSEPTIIEADVPRPQVLRIELHRRVPRGVRVLDPRGAPVSGAALALDAHRAGNSLTARDPRRGFSGYGMGFDRRWPELVDRALTGADGTATLHAAPGSHELTLSVEAAGFLRRDLPGLAFAAGEPDLEIRLAPGAAIQGHLHLPGIEANRVRIHVEAIDVPGLERNAAPVALAGDGTFAARGLHPGTYELVPAVAIPSASMGNFKLEPARRRVTIASGETAQVELDGGAFSLGRTRGRVTFAGVPMQRVVVSLVAQDGHSRFGDFAVGDDGGWIAEDLPYGTYGVRVGVLDRGGEGSHLSCPSVVSVTVGSTPSVADEVAWKRGLLRGRVTDGSGAPVADAVLHVRTSDGAETLHSVRTGGDGAFQFDPMPVGRWRVEADGWELTPAVVDVQPASGAVGVERNARHTGILAAPRRAAGDVSTPADARRVPDQRPWDGAGTRTSSSGFGPGLTVMSCRWTRRPSRSTKSW